MRTPSGLPTVALDHPHAGLMRQNIQTILEVTRIDQQEKAHGFI